MTILARARSVVYPFAKWRCPCKELGGTDNDDEYRKNLIAAKVHPDMVCDFAGHDLCNIGNIVGVYRPGQTMKTQNPSRALIESAVAASKELKR
jgi:hypothetical protein